MSGRLEHESLQRAADDGSKRRAWETRWNSEFRQQRWIEFRDQFWPAPGWEPVGFSDGDVMARDNAIRLLEIESRSKKVTT